MQGVNRIVSRRAGGHGTLPVLICEAGVLAESEAILRYADAHLPEARRLFPDGAPEVTALCRELDAGLGPDGRRLMYAHMLPRKDLMLAFNDVGVPRWEDRMMRWLWPRRRALGRARARGARRHARAGPPARARRLRRHRRAPGRTAARTCSASASRPPTSRSPRSPPRSSCRPSTAPRCPSWTCSRSPSRATSARFREHPAGAFALRMFARPPPGRGRLISYRRGDARRPPPALRPGRDQGARARPDAQVRPARARRAPTTCRPTRASCSRRATGRRTCRTSRCPSSPATTSCSPAARASGSRSRTSGCSSAASARSSA